MDEREYLTRKKAIAGIMVMASLMLFSVLFTITILVFAWMSPIEYRPTLADYLAVDRSLSAAAVSGIATALFWSFID